MDTDINILIVDDTPDHIQTAGSILKELHYPIRVAVSGASALAAIQKQVPTLILLDIQMEDMDGFSLCRQLMDDPSYQSIAIIFVTADTDRHSLQKGFSLGARDYIIKPYHKSELLSRVKAHIRISIQEQERQAAYDELDHFCHSVSHDLKSPLQVIQQLGHMLSSQDALQDDLESMEILSKIDQKCEQTIEMIRRLLDFSKMSEINCNLQPVSLTPLADCVFQELVLLEPDRDIQFRMETLPSIAGDDSLLRLLFQNIFSNSLKFTRLRETTDIQVASKETPSSWHIEIMDNGVGFNMEYSSRLFHVFERLHSQKDYEGSGVGLAIVKRIMQKHHGGVQITSSPGQGTTVILKFPKS